MATGSLQVMEDNKFTYLLDRIHDAEFETEPFKHLQINDFLKDEHFEHITGLDTLATSGRTNRELINSIQSSGFEHIGFPGTFDSIDDYVNHRENKDSSEGLNAAFNTINSKGIVFRLADYDDPLLDDLTEIFSSYAFVDCICNKFGLDPETFELDFDKGDRSTTGLDWGIQKYLDGYEISPHPDIRKKALTWMLNINSSSKSENLNHHTHYLELTDEKGYIQKYWKHNKDEDTCWLPWEWTETVKRQTANNSIVFFSPSHDTLHGVKAEYDHLKTQRTQLYGNLWYDDVDTKMAPEWDDFIIEPKSEQDIINRRKLSYLRERTGAVKRAARNPAAAIRKIRD